jgi:hypothetical protein
MIVALAGPGAIVIAAIIAAAIVIAANSRRGEGLRARV